MLHLEQTLATLVYWRSETPLFQMAESVRTAEAKWDSLDSAEINTATRLTQPKKELLGNVKKILPDIIAASVSNAPA